MRVSIGILARNEAGRIGSMLKSLFVQTVFGRECGLRANVDHIQLVCIANGCTDQTAAKARNIIESRPCDDRFSFVVADHAIAGKSRAWNAFVHDLSDPEARYLVLLDADLEFGSETVLEQLLRRLEEDSRALVATDLPIKSINKRKLSVRDQVSLLASAQAIRPNSISGQCYCGRASELRKVWMPLALPVEDGFLAAMILTEGFTAENVRREFVVRVEDAYHYFDTHETISDFLRHERRIIAGSVINSWIFRLLWEQGKYGHVGQFIAEKNQSDPKWLDRYVGEQIATSGPWLIPLGFVVKRLTALKDRPLMAKIRGGPIAMVSTVLEVIACILANRTLRAGGANNYW